MQSELGINEWISSTLPVNYSTDHGDNDWPVDSRRHDIPVQRLHITIMQLTPQPAHPNDITTETLFADITKEFANVQLLRGSLMWN